MRFSDIPGLDNEKNRLIDSFKSNTVHHAILFSGQKGSQICLYLLLSQHINCEQKSEIDSCGECSSCIKMDKLIHPDLNFVFQLPQLQKLIKK